MGKKNKTQLAKKNTDKRSKRLGHKPASLKSQRTLGGASSAQRALALMAGSLLSGMSVPTTDNLPPVEGETKAVSGHWTDFDALSTFAK